METHRADSDDVNKRRQFISHALNHPLEHVRAARQHDVGVQLFAHVDVALYVALERSVVNFGKSLEQHFDATETFSTDSADVSVWEHVGLFLVNFRSRLKLCLVIQTNVAQLLLGIPSSLPLCGGSERVHTVPLRSSRSNSRSVTFIIEYSVRSCWVQCTTGCHQSPAQCLSNVPRRTGTRPSGSPYIWRAQKRRIGGFSLR